MKMTTSIVTKREPISSWLKFFIHTGGSWRCELRKQRDIGKYYDKSVLVLSCDAGGWIADCGQMELPERVANGRLIASAPQLLRFAMEKAAEGDTDAQMLIEGIIETEPVIREEQ